MCIAWRPATDMLASFVVVLSVLGRVGALSGPMMKDFFILKTVGVIYLKPCSVSDGIELTKFLSVQSNFLTKILRSAEELDDSQHFHVHSRAGIYVDLRCEKNRRFFDDASQARSFGLKWSWLVDVGARGQSTALLSATDLGFVNDVTTASRRVGSNDVTTSSPPVGTNPSMTEDMVLHVAFTQPAPTRRLVETFAGTWTPAQGLIYHPPRREYSLERSTLKAAIFMTQNIYHEETFVEELQNKTYMPSLDNANRFYYAVALHVADLYNCSLDLVISDGWGYPLPNGTVTGMLGMLMADKADVTVGPMRLGSDRMDFALPLFPIQRFRFPFVFKQPRRTGTWKALALQLRIDVWVYTGLVAAICCLTLSGIQMLRNSVRRRWGVQPSKVEEECLSYNAILVIGTASQQGLMSDLPDIPRRIAGTWLLFCFMMVAIYYNAATMNALLSPSPLSIRNLRDLMKSDTPLAMHDAPYFTHPPVRAILLEQGVVDRVNHYNLGFLSLDQGLQLILKGGGFCGEDFTLYNGIHATFKDEQKCELSVIQSGRPVLASFWIPKHSPYKEILFQGTLRVKEHGLVNRQNNYWYPSAPECLLNQQWLWVGLEAVTIALVIFTSGFFLCWAIFIFEILSKIYDRCREKSSRI